MTAVQPFLMFQGECGAALDLYGEVLPDFRIDQMLRYGPGEPGPEGQVKQALFTVAGQQVRCFDSPVKHAFGFTPASSFWVDCGSQDEVRRLAEGLKTGGGQDLMPVGDYGFSKLFAWVSDRFGVSWQLNFGLAMG
jgi:predicted 3-demethylubiquinone-9 3-methyltransferase (glyoxalase superfamily)